jgi:hypothetical protein
MKNLIKINPTSFILGAVLGGLAIFTIAADSQHPTVWNYRVIEQGILFPSDKDDTEALARYTSATNGWEFVSAQILADPITAQSTGAASACKMIIIQKQAKK